MSQASVELISAAIVVWTGHGKHSRPQRDESLVVAQFGVEQATDLMPQLYALEEDFYSSTAHTTAAGLLEITRRAGSEFRERHSGISEEAVRALEWCYSYDWK